jgi:phosphoglycerate dehydrogenase-like enzyme
VLLGEDRSEPDGLDQLAASAELSFAHDAASLEDALTGAEVLFVWDFRTRLLAEAWPDAPDALRWIQAGSIGTDAVLTDPVLGSGVTITNTRGVFERPIAEYVLGLLIAFAKDLRGTLWLQEQRTWQHRPTEPILAKQVLLAGAGPVAAQIALLLRAVGMEVIVVARHARHDTELGIVRATGQLDILLPHADAVVLALPLTQETFHFLSADRLARLKPTARVINVGRGGLVDETALAEALHSGRLAGAALDVFINEPLPAEHPLWGAPNLIVSPHMSGDLVGWQRTVVSQFARNLHRWRTGEPLQHVVHAGRHHRRAHRR